MFILNQFPRLFGAARRRNWEVGDRLIIADCDAICCLLRTFLVSGLSLHGVCGQGSPRAVLPLDLPRSLVYRHVHQAFESSRTLHEEPARRGG